MIDKTMTTTERKEKAILAMLQLSEQSTKKISLDNNWEVMSGDEFLLIYAGQRIIEPLANSVMALLQASRESGLKQIRQAIGAGKPLSENARLARRGNAAKARAVKEAKSIL